MKKIVAGILLFMMLLPSASAGESGSIWNRRRKKIKELERQNTALQLELDSLRAVMDSLLLRIQEDEAVVTGAMEEDGGREYTVEYADSLMDSWYRQKRDYEFEKYRNMDLDSVRFSSDVSDAVMMKRLSEMNSYITVPFNETVKKYIILYSEKLPKHVGRNMGRSLYYFPIFEEALARYGLPLELKYMAIVESNLNPVAKSPAGAAGIWQFMYRTGIHYGLRIDSFVDERLDVEKAADAAARFLQRAYDMFGDWNLAISSYNCGSGNVNKAIKRAGGKRDFWSIYPYLPNETRNYVPAFVGVMYAFNYHKEYGIMPEDVGMPAAVDTFSINRNLHFRQINELVGVPLETIRLLNPQYIHDIIPGKDGKCILTLPYSYTNGFLAAEKDSLYSYRSEELLSTQVIKGIEEESPDSRSRVAYKVKSGDFLGKIASRNHCTVAQLKKWNHLRSDKLRIGQVLYIYRR